MLKLEDIREDAAVNGIAPGQVVRVVTTEPVGDNALMVYYRTADGQLAERMLLVDLSARRSSLPTGNGKRRATVDGPVQLVVLKEIRVMPKAGFIPDKLKPWIEARQRYRLSHAQVQMARELGMNPKKLGSIANYRQEPWKMPLPQFIEYCYEKQFRRKQPQDIRSIEEKEAEKRVRQNSSRGERPDVSDTKIGLIKPVQMRSSLSQEATLVQIVKEVEEQPIQMVDEAK